MTEKVRQVMYFSVIAFKNALRWLIQIFLNRMIVLVGKVCG